MYEQHFNDPDNLNDDYWYREAPYSDDPLDFNKSSNWILLIGATIGSPPNSFEVVKIYRKSGEISYGEGKTYFQALKHALKSFGQPNCRIKMLVES